MISEGLIRSHFSKPANLYTIILCLATSIMRSNHPQATSVFGIYFCPRCSNIMSPAKANGSLLEFSCQTCGNQEIDFSQRFNEDCLLYTKELQKRNPLLTQTPRSTSPTTPTSSTPPCSWSRSSAPSAATTRPST